MASLRGEPVDRPAVCFYEITGYTGDQNPADDDPHNIYSHPSWQPLLDLAWECSDMIPRRRVTFCDAPPDPAAAWSSTATWTDANGSRFTRHTIRTPRRELTSLRRRDPDVNTTWTLEHLLKDTDDFQAWLDLPWPEFGGVPETGSVLETERAIGDRGIVMIDQADPICEVAALFDMATFTVIALTDPVLMRRALDKVMALRLPQVTAIAATLPGRLWRIVGPEYASPPYLPPHLFHEYVTCYDTPLISAIQRPGGFARIHSHGRLRDILGHIAATGCMGLDPIEPPHQGDVTLAYVREKCGRQMTLFGNIEASDLENLDAGPFRAKVATALREGTAGAGRGFVLMPSACPYGRVITARTLANYRIMVEMAGALAIRAPKA
jgi:hypothetical protein